MTKAKVKTTEAEALVIFRATRKRVTYGLGFKRSDREFIGGAIAGPDIDDAYSSDPDAISTGEWGVQYEPDDEHSPNEWLREMFAAAIAEAVHEVCEWFRVDGKVAVDPHDGALFLEEALIEKSVDAGRAIWSAHARAELRA